MGAMACLLRNAVLKVGAAAPSALWLPALLVLFAGCASTKYAEFREVPHNPLTAQLRLLDYAGPQPGPRTVQLLRRYDLADEFFGEGLALANDRLYQLTWREGTALVYDLETGADTNTFEPIGGYLYNDREGWGLCYDGEFLYHSDGSNSILLREPESFTPVDQIEVTMYGAFVDQLNELECVGDDLYANVWNSDVILRIDKATGDVTGVIDASSLLTAEQRSTLSGSAVLNGIAYDEANDVFLVTGKLWPSLFEVEFVPLAG